MLLQPLSDDDLISFGMSEDTIEQVYTVHTYFYRVSISLVIALVFFSM